MPSNRRLMRLLKLFFPICFPPDGMINPAQSPRLFLLGLMNTGPILELGPWIGRSTIYLASALKLKRSKVRLQSLDIHFSSRQAFEEYFNENLDNTPAWRRERYMRHLVKEEGTLTSLKENLAERGLSNYVDCLKGYFEHYDFGSTQFSMVFCDITHDLAEVEKNIPKIKTLLLSDYILVCDDIRYEDMYHRLIEIISPELALYEGHMLFCAHGKKSVSALKRISWKMMSPNVKFSGD